MYKEPDIFLIEFYIKRKYGKKLEEYFNVSNPVASAWRNEKFPEKRIMEFYRKEETLNSLELFNRIYKKD